MNKIYLDTARMLVQVAPLVFRDSPFALKGGTAINLFVRDMPREIVCNWRSSQSAGSLTGSGDKKGGPHPAARL